MKLGVVGLPNVGKSTLFNAITHAGAQAANFPFCTIEPNVGIVAVPDERLDKLASLYQSKKITPMGYSIISTTTLQLPLIFKLLINACVSAIAILFKYFSL